jgi:DNA processing protein
VIRLSPTDASYPDRLLELKRPPDPLWVWGTLPPRGVRTVGVVGTRRLTEYGRRIAREVTMALSRAGAVVVSGLAQGVDSVAHTAALEVGGRTIAVLGEGIAYFDDKGAVRRRQLAQRIRKQGALVSEWELDVRGNEWTFPRRNLTLAALCDALVVVEAPIGSGALITAERMRDVIKRPIFIVPGPLGAPTWEGSNKWIAEGWGTLLACAQQVADKLELGPTLAPVSSSGGHLAARLIAYLAAEPADVDTIASALQIRSAEATTLIAEQVIAGRVTPMADGRFARVA